MKRRSGKLLACVLAIVFVGVLIVVVVLPSIAVRVNQKPAKMLKSKTMIRMHVTGLNAYAEHNAQGYPTKAQWPGDLQENGYIEQDLLVSPVEDGDGVSYIYIPGPFTHDATQILIYEDPKHWPDRGVLVGFADNHVEFVPFDVFDRMLRAQQLREIDLLKSITYIRGLMIGVQSYANNENGGVLPAQNEWPDKLARWMNTDLLVSPVEESDGVSYIYVPGENTLNADQILVYEDPKHWPKRGVLVGFADNHVEFVSFGDFDRMLAAQLAQSPSAP